MHIKVGAAPSCSVAASDEAPGIGFECIRLEGKDAMLAAQERQRSFTMLVACIDCDFIRSAARAGGSRHACSRCLLYVWSPRGLQHRITERLPIRVRPGQWDGPMTTPPAGLPRASHSRAAASTPAIASCRFGSATRAEPWRSEPAATAPAGERAGALPSATRCKLAGATLRSVRSSAGCAQLADPTTAGYTSTREVHPMRQGGRT
jgi:hypothetical protein